MEYLHQFLHPSILFPITIIALFLCHHLLWKSKAKLPKKTPQPPPEPGRALPIIGHLHLLYGPQPLHKTLGQMADKYGPIFTIRTGVHRDLIVSNWEIAKECLTTNDKVFANRPKILAAQIMTFDGVFFAYSPYGPYWRQARKVATMELLSNHRLEALLHVRESEVRTAIKELFDDSRGDKEIEMKRWFDDITLNLMCRVVAGKRFLEATASESKDMTERSRRALRHLLEFLGTFFVSDAIPWLRWLDFGHERAMKKMMRELDQLAQRWLNEHKIRKKNGIDNSTQDFMDIMLSIIDDQGFGNSKYDADTIIKYTSVGMIVAAKDTTTITMTWALALLLNNREALKKVQEELDQHVGRDRQVKESDIKNLVYLQAIVKETLRLYPANPISSPHESIEDCNVAGHHIPARTRLLLNLTKIQRDPKVWARPDEFIPERFLEGGDNKNVDVRGQNFELLPFGSGRRMCPGVSLALQVTQLSLAALLQGFDILTPSDQLVDMTESLGFQNYKISPLHIRLTQRLPTRVY